MTPFEGITYWTAVLLYALAFGSGLAGSLFDRSFLRRMLPLWTLAGLVSHLAAFVSRTLHVKHVPTMGNYENILTGALFIVILALWFFRKPERQAGLTGTLPFIILLMGFSAFSDTVPRPFVASLKSYWLYVHIFFAWWAYASFTAAAGVAAAYLSAIRKGKHAERLEELMFRLTAFGLITDAVMIASGSIWARDLWGSYWSWDPVETWSLISFLIYGIILHLKITLKWKGKSLAWMLIAALMTVILSFWGVNLIVEKSLHVFNVG